MNEVKISINDAKKAVYFIANLTQMQGDRPMQGALTSKADYMGGIFDRWINIIPESVLFNKIILPQVFKGEKVEVITDYYDYNPKTAGIAPDVIGIKYKKRAIPFVKFDNHWFPIEKRPQIEVKTFKINQYMISLRNQGYDQKYLVMAEANFRVDYLIPLLNKALFSKQIFLDLHMDDKIFIISNDEGNIAQPHKVELSDKTLGSVKLLVVTTAEDFMKKAVKCKSRVSIEYIKSCEEYSANKLKNAYCGNLLDYCTGNENGLYYFNSNWYENVDEEGITYKNGKKVRTTGFYVSSPEDIDILKNFFDVFIITDGRLLFEFEELKRRFPSVKIIHVIRDNYENELTEQEKQHVTETEMEDYTDYDYIVRNTSKERLYSEADKIMGVEKAQEGEVI